jgi:hypothetical protein
MRTALGTNSCGRASRFAANSFGKKIDQAGDKTKLDWVFADAEDDRDRRGCSFGGKRSKIAGWCSDNGHTTMHELSHKRRKAIKFALRPMVLHRYILALDVTGPAEALAERGGKGRIG